MEVVTKGMGIWMEDIEAWVLNNLDTDTINMTSKASIGKVRNSSLVTRNLRLTAVQGFLRRGT